MKKPISLNKIKEDYIVKQMRVLDICLKYDICAASFYQVLKENNIKKRGKKGIKTRKILK